MSLELVFFTLLVVGGLLAVRIIVLEQRLKPLVIMSAKIDALLRHSGISPNLEESLPEELREGVIEAIRQGRKIEAIKRYREATGTGLREAKEVIDFLAKQTNNGA